MLAAFEFAESTFSFPCILTPEQVIDFGDEKSILTYLSLIYNAHLSKTVVCFTFCKLEYFRFPWPENS